MTYLKINLLHQLDRAWESAEQSKKLIAKTYSQNLQAAHDLASPMSAVNAVAEKLQSENQSLYRILKTAAKRINGIGQGLLTEHKANVVNVDADFFDISECLSEVLADKEREFKHIKNLAFELKLLTPILSPFRLPKTDFYRVLSNLLNNAVEAMDIDQKKQVLVIVEAKKNQIVIQISDNGRGISINLQKDIFLDNITTKEKGTGLGLGFCKKTVEAWGGQLVLRTSGPSGSTFEITLPNPA